MKEPGEPEDREAPPSEPSRSRRPAARSVPAASIGDELGKLEFEPDALLDGLFEETPAPAPPPVGERESFAPAPVHPSRPPDGPRWTDDDEQTSIFWRSNDSSQPPASSSQPPASSSQPPASSDDPAPLTSALSDAPGGDHPPVVFGSEAPTRGAPAPQTFGSEAPTRGAYVPESFLPPAEAGELDEPFESVEADEVEQASSLLPEADEAERTVRRTLEPVPGVAPSRPAEPPSPLRPQLEPAPHAFPSQPPEAPEAERTVRRSLGTLTATVPPLRSPTRSSAAPPLLDEPVALDPRSPAAWRQRAEWLESEAHAAPSPEAKARALVVASELWALAGEPGRGREVAIEAAAIGSASLGDRQLRWLAAVERDFDSVVTALEAEQLSAATPEARAHAAYLSAEVTRLVLGDDAVARHRHEAASRNHPDDPRPHLMRLVEQLSATNGSPKLRWPERPEFSELARATEELARLRSPVGGAPGTPLGAFENAHEGLSVGERGHAASAVLELSALEGVGDAGHWLAAALLAGEAVTRPAALGWFERLANQGDSMARRALARHALAVADRPALERALAIGPGALPETDRLSLALLGGARDPELERRFGELLEGDETSRTLLAAGLLAGELEPTLPLPLASSPERDALTLGRLLWQTRELPLGEAAELEPALERYARSNPDRALTRALSLELALARGDAESVARALGGWAAAPGDAAALRDRELAAALVRELSGDTQGARDGYERAFELDPAHEPAARALLEGVAPAQASEILLRLAEAESPGSRAAVHFVEAALSTRDHEPELFEPALERAREADPSLFLAYRLGEERARETVDIDRRLAWVRARRQHAELRSDAALALVREALLSADTDLAAAATLLKEALDAAPDDVPLLDLYLRSSSADEPGRGVLWESVSRRASGPLAAELWSIAALEYERESDRSSAYRAAEQALQHGGGELRRVIAERLALGSDGAQALAETLQARLSGATDPVERRELCQRLAELERARDDAAAALSWERAAVERDPTHVPALRALERAALRTGDRELLATTEAALARLLSGADAAAAAALAVRLLPPDAAPDGALELALLALEQQPYAAWALRTVSADPEAPPERAGVAYRELAALATRPLDRATLSLRGAEAATRAGRYSEARVLLDQALNEVPDHLVALTTLAEVLERAGDPAEAARAYEALAEASRIDTCKAAAFHRAAVLWLEQASDPDRGLSALEQATSLDLTHEEAVLRLQSLYVTRGERHKLAELLLRRVEQSRDADERMALEVARSRVLAEVGEQASAKAALSAALDAQPDHAGALEALAELCLGEGDWTSAEQALLRLSRHAASAEQQADVYRRLAELYDTSLPNPERAELAYREVLRRAPDDAEAVDRLVGVYARLGRKEDAVQLASDFAERAAAPELRRERIVRLALVLERVASDKSKAEATLEKARREAPHDARLLRALVELRRRAGEDHLARALLERAASDARRALGTGRFEYAFFETLATVAELRGQPDAARIAQSTLAALAGTELPLVGAGAAAGSPSLDDLLAPELLDPRIRQLIRRTGAVLDSAYPPDLRALRATPLPPGSLSYFAHVQKVAESFELGTIEVLVSPSLGMNCVPLSAAPARLLVGPELLKSSDEATRFALLVRALKVLQLSAPVITRTSPVELVPLFGGLVASLVPDGAPQPGVDVRKAGEAAAKIAPVLPPELAAELAPLAREIAPLVATRSSQLGSAVLQWASRTALLAVGDLHTLLMAVSRASGLSAGPPSSGPERLKFVVRNPEARDVAIFSVSDHYAEARRRLELGS